MSKLYSGAAVAILALGACGDDGGDANADAAVPDAPADAKQFFDAPPPMYNFQCIGNGQPSSATATITLSGTVQRVSVGAGGIAFNAVAAASVKACNATNNMCTGAGTATTVTASDGTFSLGPINTGSVPLNDFIEMAKDASVRKTFTYPASPFVASFSGLPILTLDPFLVSNVLPNFGCTQNDGTNGMLALVFTDCADAPITDSTNLAITIKQGGNEISASTQMLDLGAISAMAAGTFLVCNVPENGTTTVGATYTSGGVPRTFRSHNVKVVKATTTATLVRPGW